MPARYKTIDPAGNHWRQNYRLLVGSVVPRPIAWVSTISADGYANLAPFSFFTCVGHDPPLLSISVGVREGASKDTARNIMETRGYVIHAVVDGLEEQMNVCADDYAFGVSEFEEAGLTPIPSDLVKAPRVAEAPVAMECAFRHLLTTGREHLTNVIIGEVVRWHVREDVTIEDGKYIDPVLLRPVGRLAGNGYCRSHDVFEMQRPDRKAGQASPRG